MKTVNEDLYKPFVKKEHSKPFIMEKRDLDTMGKKSFFYHNPILNPLPSY